MQSTSGVQTAHVTMGEPRCWRCNRKLAELVTSPWMIRCSRCKATNQGESDREGGSLGAVNERDAERKPRAN